MQYLQSLWKEEDAMGVVEVLLIIVDNLCTSSTYILS